MKTGKKILSLLLTLALLWSMGVTAAAEGEQGLSGAIVIIHTNDVHGELDGYAKVAAMKQVYEAQGAYVLLLDAGDYLQGQLYVSHSQGAVAIELMNAAGYDAAAVGDEEFAYGLETLRALAEEAAFPLLSANILSGNEPAFSAHQIFEAPDGTKLGVFSLTAPDISEDVLQGASVLSGEALAACAREEVEELEEQGCDWIICLGHLGITGETGSRSIDLLEQVEGIDFFIDGHSHSTLEDIKTATGGSAMIGETAITSAGAGFSNVGVLIIKDGAYVSMNLPGATIVVSDEAIAARAQEIMNEVNAATGLAAYTDVKADAWYAEAVRFVTAAGLMNGSGDRFDPTGTLNRAMMVTVLYRMAGSPTVEGPSAFTDVAEGAWYADAVAWAVEQGITTGASETTFNPSGAVTREQLATFLYRYAGSPAVEGDLSGYTDAAQVGSYAVAAMVWANAQGLVTGTTASVLAPRLTANRATVATVLMRYAGEN